MGTLELRSIHERNISSLCHRHRISKCQGLLFVVLHEESCLSRFKLFSNGGAVLFSWLLCCLLNFPQYLRKRCRWDSLNQPFTLIIQQKQQQNEIGVIYCQLSLAMPHVAYASCVYCFFLATLMQILFNLYISEETGSNNGWNNWVILIHGCLSFLHSGCHLRNMQLNLLSRNTRLTSILLTYA